MEERAKDLAKQQETEKAQLDSAIKDISDELVRKPAYEAEFEEAQSELSRVEKVTKEQESRLNGLRQEKESLENKKAQLIQLEEHIRDTERALERWDDQVKQHHAQLKEYEELIAQRSTIEEGYTQFVKTKELCDELERRFRQSVNLEKQKSQLDSKIREAGQSLITDHALAQSRIKELEASSRKLPQLKNELSSLQVQLRHLAELDETLLGRRQANQELLTQVHHLESNKTQLEQEIKEIQEKLNLLSTQTEAKCPLCERELEVEGLKLIETKYADDRHSKSNSLKLNQVELDKNKTELESLEKEVSQLDARLKQDRASAQSKVSILSQSISEAEEAGNRLNEERKRLAGLEAKSVIKKFKQKGFAAGANRQQIALCSEIGIEFDQFIELGLAAMKAIAADLGL
ncbi:unnamed protein product [marine sediment metagenome]|uniref:Zinc-hook domain-containing protein n=1 Tax=marine sediment metagenome TaxID=412755 RepID=X1EQF0_9ZZZZ